MFACRPKRVTKLLNCQQRNPRIPENMAGTKNTDNCKTRISSTPAEHDRGLFIQFVTKLRDPWPSENVETPKLSHTEGRKITSTLTKCLDRADTLQNTEAFTCDQAARKRSVCRCSRRCSQSESWELLPKVQEGRGRMHARSNPEVPANQQWDSEAQGSEHNGAYFEQVTCLR